MTNELMLRLAAADNHMDGDRWDYTDGAADYRSGQPIRTNPSVAYLDGWADARIDDCIDRTLQESQEDHDHA